MSFDSPRTQPPLPTLEEVCRLVAKAFPGRSVSSFEALTGGLCNTNLKVDFESDEEPVVLRLHQRRPAACQKEVELLRLVRKTVPVPEVFYAEPEAIDGARPFALLEYVPGITFQTLKRTQNVAAIEQASYSAGKTLAAIGQYEFPKPGRIVDGLQVGAPYVEGPEPIRQFVDMCLASDVFQRRTGPVLARRLHEFILWWTLRLPKLDQSCLVHSDYGSRNILVREVRRTWSVVAVLDWEFAFSGSPLLDVGNFLRYEPRARPLREPHFSRGFIECGGKLPENWWHVARVIDLTALCDLLTRDELPDEIENEVLDLVMATLEDRDPAVQE
jgi:aminoglycoside phosphotransferase (APT) family kinase protein